MSAPVTTPRAEPLKPILTAHLFPRVDGLLLKLLLSLSPGDWERQTVSPKWKVKDVAAHLLDTPLRGLSMGRDSYPPPAPKLDSNAALGAYINQLNDEGVTVYRRLSPAVLISLMEVACKQLADYHASRDPYAMAPYGVSWAGEEKSANWFDTAREYTERWHHQQQIRLAVDPSGTAIRITVSGKCGGSWHLYREQARWALTSDERAQPAAETVIPQEIAWRIFTKGIDHESVWSQVKTAGDRALALPVLGMVSIVSA